MTDTNSSADDSPEKGPSEIQTCEKCGVPLEPSAVGLLCPACLMQMGMDSKVQDDADPNVTQSLETMSEVLAVDETVDAVQALFPTLEIIEILGRGGMGVVYKARQKHLDRLIALKILRTRCSGDPSLIERFTREAKALARLSHPNIVGVHDFGQAGDRPYLMMEYIDGTNLRSMLEAHSLNPKEAMAMVPAICEALQFAHEVGVVHRDIKPENILIDRRGRIRIADFGLARLMTRSEKEWTLTGTRQVMGTPHYMAPEQIEHPQSVDHRADIYSLGVVIYEMLTGELPIGRFELPSRKVSVDVRLDDIVLRTLEKEPQRRYQAVTDVQTDVERVSSSSRSLPSISTDRRQKLYQLSTYGMLVAAAFDGVAAVVSIFAVMFMREGPDEFVFGLWNGLFAVGLGMGAWHLLQRPTSSRGVLVSILAMVPVHVGAIVGLPAGIAYLIAYFMNSDRRGDPIMQATSLAPIGEFGHAVHQKAQTAIDQTNRLGRSFLDWLLGCWRSVRRSFVFLLLTIVGWSFVGGLSAFIYYTNYYENSFPTTLSVTDSSAADVGIQGEERIRLTMKSRTWRDRYGFLLSETDFQRESVSVTLYVDTLTGENSATKRRRFYCAQSLVIYPNREDSVDYQIEPSGNIVNISGMLSNSPARFIEQHEFRSVAEGKAQGEASFADANVYSSNGGLVYFSSRPALNRNTLTVDYSDRQFRPALENVDPIQSWLTESGMKSPTADKVAAGLYSLAKELARTQGHTRGPGGHLLLLPIAELLDKEVFEVGKNAYVSITVTPRDWAMAAWICGTIATCLLGMLTTLFVSQLFARRRARQLPTGT